MGFFFKKRKRKKHPVLTIPLILSMELPNVVVHEMVPNAELHSVGTFQFCSHSSVPLSCFILPIPGASVRKMAQIRRWFLFKFHVQPLLKSRPASQSRPAFPSAYLSASVVRQFFVELGKRKHCNTNDPCFHPYLRVVARETKQFQAGLVRSIWAAFSEQG